LRAAARRKSTYRIRWWTALLAMGMSFVALFFLWMTQTRSAGNPLFGILTGYTFALCVFAGVFLTADCLSEEKREGTLGLLFLTDLKAYDVVLGKFFARWLNAFYALLALVPVTGIPLLLGGVTGSEFWRMALALANMLFFSLATGMLISALVKDARHAMSATFGLLFLFVVGLPLAATFLQDPSLAPVLRPLESSSAFYPFYYAMDVAYTGQPDRFWWALAGSNLLAVLFIVAASVVLPRSWQEGALSPHSGILTRLLPQNRHNKAGDKRQRDRMLSVNPVFWLLGREAGLRWLVWGIVIIWGILVLFLSGRSAKSMSGLYYPARGCGFVLKMLVAIQVCRFFVEGRRSGALEVLLATPLRNREVLRGQTLALKSIFLWPLVVFLAFNFIPVGAEVANIWSRSGASQAWQVLGGMVGLGMGSLMVLWLALGLFADIFAIAAVGSWLALSMKKPALAPAATILYVLVLPSIAICGLDLLVDLIFILWGTTNLSQDLRWTVSRPYQDPVIIPPRQFVTKAGLPPVIPTGSPGQRQGLIE
jgi:ABC-type transport system involved in multi-copper enzyme maturation permease subunit